MDTDRHQPADSYALDRPEELASEADRLPRQAATSFPLELPGLVKHGLGGAQALLDLGSGEGAYLDCLARAFPALKVVGIEANGNLIARCRECFPGLLTWQGDVSDPETLQRAILKVKPDVITARYVLQHLAQAAREGLLETIRAEKGAARFVCIDADDDLFQVFPVCPAFAEINRINIERQASRGGDRLIGKRLVSMFERHGFEDIRASPVLVSSQEVGLSTWWDTYGPAFRRGFDDFAASAAHPLFQEVERWISDHMRDRSAWISKVVHIVSGR